MGKQNNIVKFGVPGFFGCSSVPGCSDVPVFRGVPVSLVIVHALINPCGIFEKMTSFTPIFNQEGTRKINDSRRFTEIRVQKNVRSILRNRLKFGKLSRADLLCTKM